jgi:hypothetical protein
MLHRMGDCTTASELKPLYFKVKVGLDVVLGNIQCFLTYSGRFALNG